MKKFGEFLRKLRSKIHLFSLWKKARKNPSEQNWLSYIKACLYEIKRPSLRPARKKKLTDRYLHAISELNLYRMTKRSKSFDRLSLEERLETAQMYREVKEFELAIGILRPFLIDFGNNQHNPAYNKDYLKYFEYQTGFVYVLGAKIRAEQECGPEVAKNLIDKAQECVQYAPESDTALQDAIEAYYAEGFLANQTNGAGPRLQPAA